MMRTLTSLALVLISVSLAGCGSGGGAGPAGGSLRITTNPQPSDTIGATVGPIPIFVLDDESDPVVGAEVRFADLSFRENVTATKPYASVGTSDFDGPGSGSGGVDFSDQDGRARVWLQLGQIAGEARIEVRCDDVGAVDTILYRIHPGRRVGVAMLLKDTAAYVGRTVQLRGAVVDRSLNPRSEPVTYTGMTPNVETNPQGLLTAKAIGRGMVLVTSMGDVDTAWVSVVPEGRMGGFHLGPNYPPGMATVDLDGSNYQFLVPVPSYWSSPGCVYCSRGAVMSWAPGRTRYVHTALGYPRDGRILRPRLYSAVVGSSTSELLLVTEPGVAHEGPQFSRDGEWIYFAEATPAYTYSIFRVRPDGTGKIHVGPAKNTSEVNWLPSPSPDGGRIAYVTNALGPTSIRVFDMVTGTISAWSTPGTHPRWSPVHDVIAFVEAAGGSIKLINADGTGERTISEPGVIYMESVFDWSPDGKWLLAHSSRGRTELIEVESGMTLPLPFTNYLYGPSWQSSP